MSLQEKDLLHVLSLRVSFVFRHLFVNVILHRMAHCFLQSASLFAITDSQYIPTLQQSAHGIVHHPACEHYDLAVVEWTE